MTERGAEGMEDGVVRGESAAVAAAVMVEEEEEEDKEEEEEEDDAMSAVTGTEMLSACKRVGSEDFGTKKTWGAGNDDRNAAGDGGDDGDGNGDDDDDGDGDDDDDGDGDDDDVSMRSNAAGSAQSKCDKILGSEADAATGIRSSPLTREGMGNILREKT
jgi:hypothetical protein